jgi:hypothetical protein
MSPLLGRLGAPLEVDDRVTLARLSPSRLADRDIKRLRDTTVQSAIPIPQLKIQMRRAFRRQIFRQSLPLAAGREHRAGSGCLNSFPRMISGVPPRRAGPAE